MWHEGVEIARRIRAWEGGETPGPYTLELYPTLRCNMGCLFCDTQFRDPEREDVLTADDLAAIVDDAAEMDVRRVMLLGGGEPLLSRVVPLVERIKSTNIEGVLSTNGTLLDRELAQMLVDVGWDEVQVSLEAADPRVNDYLRGTPGALAKVAGNVCRLRELRETAGRDRPRILFHAVLTSKNLQDLTGLVEMAGVLGAYRVNVDALIAYRAEQQALLPTEEQLAELPRVVEAAGAAAHRLGLEHNLDSLVDPQTTRRGAMKLPRRGAHTIRNAPCLNPWYYMVVDAAGQASTCCVITGTGEDVRERGLRDTWERGPLFTGLREDMRRKKVPGRCRECSIAMISRNEELRGLIEAA